MLTTYMLRNYVIIANIQDAISILEKLGDFKDSKMLIIEIKELQYSDAEKFFAAENYEQAYKTFSELGEYKDSKERADISKHCRQLRVKQLF